MAHACVMKNCPTVIQSWDPHPECFFHRSCVPGNSDCVSCSGFYSAHWFAAEHNCTLREAQLAVKEREGSSLSMGNTRGDLCMTQVTSGDPDGAPVLDRDGTATGADPTLSEGDALPASIVEAPAMELQGNTGGDPNTDHCVWVSTSAPDRVSIPANVGPAVCSAALPRAKATGLAPAVTGNASFLKNTLTSSASPRASVPVQSDRLDWAKSGGSLNVVRPPQVDPAQAGIVQGLTHDVLCDQDRLWPLYHGLHPGVQKAWFPWLRLGRFSWDPRVLALPGTQLM